MVVQPAATLTLSAYTPFRLAQGNTLNPLLLRLLARGNEPPL